MLLYDKNSIEKLHTRCRVLRLILFLFLLYLCIYRHASLLRNLSFDIFSIKNFYKQECFDQNLSIINWFGNFGNNISFKWSFIMAHPCLRSLYRVFFKIGQFNRCKLCWYTITLGVTNILPGSKQNSVRGHQNCKPQTNPLHYVGQYVTYARRYHP